MQFSYFCIIFSCFSIDISRTAPKVRFRRYKLSRTSEKFAKSRKFLPLKQLIHNLWVFHNFFQKSLFAENYFLIAVMNLTTRGP